jgi:hypothetical protein
MEMAVAALIPSIGVGLLFWYVVRLIISADRNERRALAELDRQAAADNRRANSVDGVQARSAGASQVPSDS